MTSRFTKRVSLAISLFLALSCSAFAQYGGGGTGTGGSGSGTVYTAPKGGYSSTTGIAIGAGAAAGVALAYFALHKSSVMGCVESSSDGLKLMNEKDKKTYALVPGDEDLKPGEKVELKGKKEKDSSGKLAFRVQKMAKDYGTCTP